MQKNTQTAIGVGLITLVFVAALVAGNSKNFKGSVRFSAFSPDQASSPIPPSAPVLQLADLSVDFPIGIDPELTREWGSPVPGLGNEAPEGTRINAFYGTVRNGGAAQAQINNTAYELKDTVTGRLIKKGKIGMETIAAGSSGFVRFDDVAWGAENRGSYTMEICTDVDNMVFESNEENNCAFRIFEVIPR